jgi:membrane dipeptidase
MEAMRGINFDSQGVLTHNRAVNEPLRAWWADAVVWDNHACMPLRADDSFLPQLERCRQAGLTVLTLNIGFDLTSFEQNLQVLAHFRHFVHRHPDRYLLVHSPADIHEARRSGRLGICFNLEGTRALGDQLSMIELFHSLGVKWMLMAYNRNNSVGGGCQDDDGGLTPFGREVLDEMKRVGIVPCCSHTGWRTAMQVMEHVGGPVIFSHSNSHALHAHPRNIPDELIKACASTGGVVGINGVGPFLGVGKDGPVAAMVRHIDHMVQLVGPDHVGLALDYVFDMQELQDYFAAHPEAFPPEEGYGGHFRFVPPEQIPALIGLLLDRGYPRDAILKIIGGNHLRVAAAAWH